MKPKWFKTWCQKHEWEGEKCRVFKIHLNLRGPVIKEKCVDI